jgi:hypothetical protein
MLKVALRVPLTDGVNTTVKVVDPEAFTVAPGCVVTLKSEA